ncbi:MAG: redoxin domain-containing protein, partial [Candidatus Hydrogenedentes bacterium]|nr:redoxin domain-containing protein [Candidatus Hydrogenedentota bacterium]
DFNDWQLGEDVADSAFAFTPSAEAEKVDDVIASLRERAAEQQMADTGLEIGSPAPAFAMSPLDGGAKVSLEDLKGKPVVLDFFASWCQWCYVGLPTIWEVSQEYADDGLIFYAVNIEETPEQAKEMMTSLEIDPPILMDPDGAVGSDYSATGLPYTVVIDKDGNVANIHRGVPQDKNVYKTMLRADFDAIVGKESK